MQKTLTNLADQLLAMDPEALLLLQPQVQARMEQADGSLEWERAVVAFFMISALRVKEHLAQAAGRPSLEQAQEPPRLRVVK